MLFYHTVIGTAALVVVAAQAFGQAQTKYDEAKNQVNPNVEYTFSTCTPLDEMPFNAEFLEAEGIDRVNVSCYHSDGNPALNPADPKSLVMRTSKLQYRLSPQGRLERLVKVAGADSIFAEYRYTPSDERAKILISGEFMMAPHLGRVSYEYTDGTLTEIEISENDAPNSTITFSKTNNDVLIKKEMETDILEITFIVDGEDRHWKTETAALTAEAHEGLYPSATYFEERANGRVIRRFEWDNGAPKNTTVCHYNKFGNLEKQDGFKQGVIAGGSAWTTVYEYDKFGNLVLRHHAGQNGTHITRFEYDKKGKRLTRAIHTIGMSDEDQQIEEIILFTYF